MYVAQAGLELSILLPQCSVNHHVWPCLLFFFFLVVLGFELKGSHMLGGHCTASSVFLLLLAVCLVVLVSKLRVSSLLAKCPTT
jgi:hypothetical protein